MGLFLILLGLFATGVVADMIIESGLISAPNQVITLFHTKASVSGLAVVFSCFILGALAVFLIVIGIGVMRGSWGRRRMWQRRIEELEWQNTELRSRERLNAVVQAEHARHIVALPESGVAGETEPVPQPDAEPQPAPAPEEIGASN